MADCESFSMWLFILAAIGWVAAGGLTLLGELMAIGRLFECLASQDEPVSYAQQIKRPIFATKLWCLRRWMQ